MEKLIGPGLKNLSQEDFNKFKKERNQLGIEKHPRELEKTYEEKELIKSILISLNNEMENLGLHPVNFPIKKIHLLPKHYTWYPGIKLYAKGVFTDKKDDIEVEVSRRKNINNIEKIKDILHQIIHFEPILYLSDREHDAKTIIHELTHAKSSRGFFVNSSNEIAPYKSGYSTNKIKGKELVKNDYYFNGFNEAVTEKIARELLLKNKDKIMNKDEGRNLEENLSKHGSYSGYITVLDKIIDMLAQFEYKNKEEIWSRFKKNYFTGEMMHFRKIEEVFGVGSLRILAAMDSSTMSPYDLEEGSKFAKYFSSGTTYEEREKLAEEILSEEEYFKKEKHREILESKRNKYI